MNLDSNMLGHFEYTLDKKNRLFIPAKFRELLGEELVVGPSFRDEALAIYSQQEFQKIYQTAMEKFNGQQKHDFQRQFVTQCSNYTPDEQGRITLSAFHVKKGGFDGTVIIEGDVDCVKLWSVDRFNAEQAKPVEYSLTDLADLGNFG